MEVLVILVPLALGLGLAGLFGFLWSLKSGQFDDLDGAALRAIADDEPVNEEPPRPWGHAGETDQMPGPLRRPRQAGEQGPVRGLPDDGRA